MPIPGGRDSDLSVESDEGSSSAKTHGKKMAKLGFKVLASQHQDLSGCVDDQEEEDRKEWSRTRIALDVVLQSMKCDIALGVVILFNIVIIVLETDATADGQDSPAVYLIINTCLRVVYTIELVLRLFTYRRSFFFRWWNNVDMLIVFLDWCMQIIMSQTQGADQGSSRFLSALRICRLAKLARAFRVLVMFPELHMILRGLFATILAIVWGMVALATAVVLFSIVAVEFIHPINREIDYGDVCPNCAEAFSTVWRSSITIFQTVVAGDSWGLVALPVIQESKSTFFFFFFPVYVTIVLLVLNLILATTVERASEARSQDERELLKRENTRKQKDAEQAKMRLLKMCHEMDEDHSQSLTKDELKVGFAQNEDFRHLLLSMDIDEKDIDLVFNILDDDGDSNVNYEEFVEQLHMMKTHSSHTLLVFIMHTVRELSNKLGRGADSSSPGAHRRPSRPEFGLARSGSSLTRSGTRLLDTCPACESRHDAMQKLDKGQRELESAIEKIVDMLDVVAI